MVKSRRVLAYNQAGQLITTQGGGVSASYAYNGLGDRYRQTVNGVQTSYVLDLASALTEVLAETTDGVTTNYLLGLDVLGQQQGSTWSYFGLDGLGSVRHTTDASGNVTNRFDYTPYGVPLTTRVPGVTLGFTGEPTDANKLVYLRARYLSPELGMFLTRDPVAGVLGRAMSRNGYSYVEGNPVTYTDPSGKNPFAGIIAAALAAPAATILILSAAVLGTAFLLQCATTPGCMNPINDVLDKGSDLIHQACDTVRDTVDKLRSHDQPKAGTQVKEREKVEVEPKVAATSTPQRPKLGIALGYTATTYGRQILAPFALNLTNATRTIAHWDDWDTHGITTVSPSQMRDMTRREFARVVRPIILKYGRNADTAGIHVNLEDIGRQNSGYTAMRLDEFIEDEGDVNAFAYELKVIRDEELCEATTFYENGSTLPRPVGTDICGPARQ